MRYPLFLDLADERVVVIGGGRVATRKVRVLLRTGAAITVISPRASGAIRQWADRGRLAWKPRRYRRGDLRAARLAVAATDDLAVNERVCGEARAGRILVNCIAPPAAGNFIVPSSIQRGGCTLAISTAGASPSVAKQLRLDLERFLDTRYPDLASMIAAAGKQRRRRTG